MKELLKWIKALLWVLSVIAACKFFWWVATYYPLVIVVLYALSFFGAVVWYARHFVIGG